MVLKYNGFAWCTWLVDLSQESNHVRTVGRRKEEQRKS